MRETLQRLGRGRILVRADAHQQWAGRRRARRACRSLDAHRTYVRLTVDRITLAAVVVVCASRGRRRLSPGARVRRSAGSARLDISMRCGRITPTWPSKGRSSARVTWRCRSTTVKTATTRGCQTPNFGSPMAASSCRHSRRDTQTRSTDIHAALSWSCSAAARTASLVGWRTTSHRRRYRNKLTGEEFAGDYDQRHTVNIYGVYRFSDRMSFSSRFRAGSNFPVPGYFESRARQAQDSRQRTSSAQRRNNVRVPVYSRLDLRANRTFSWRATRLTLFAEVLNAVRPRQRPRVAARHQRHQHQVFGLFDSMFPLIPSAGLSLEFWFASNPYFADPR